MEALESGINDGDNRNVDMTVGDIYGDSMKEILSSDVIASSLGKSNSKGSEKKKKSDADVIKSVSIMMAINVAQLIGLYAEIERLQRFVFVSSLLRSETFFEMIQV